MKSASIRGATGSDMNYSADIRYERDKDFRATGCVFETKDAAEGYLRLRSHLSDAVVTSRVSTTDKPVTHVFDGERVWLIGASRKYPGKRRFWYAH